MTTSIMLICYNRLELTKQTLDSFFQTTKSPYRLIIVDNGSKDGTSEYLQKLEVPKYCKGYTTHFNAENKGISIGRNQALLLADQFKDKYLATIDNDVILPINWLQKCIDIIATNQKYMIGVNFEKTQYPLQIVNNKTIQFKREGNLGTACMVFPRTLFDTIGFFHDYGNLYGSEDADYGFRSRIAGYQLGYLEENGIHIGEGENDVGEYREFKTECHKKNLIPFQQNCYAYMQKRKSICINFTDKTITANQKT
jgi:GT2 family glycosyltransferase